MKKVYIIAEAGVNHNGSIGLAMKMVDAARAAKADAVKFQTFIAGNFISRFAPKAEYQKKTTITSESQFEMVRRLELDIKAHKKLIRYCHKKNLAFLSSPFDLKSIELLANLGLEVFKIPSGEITNLPYLKKIGSLKKKIILSTGMSNLEEVRKALEVLEAAGTLKKNITVLHCNTEYPTPFKDANLLAMLSLKSALGVKVGYSDHTPGIEAALAAAALGAEVIEKHFTLSRDMPGPDHQASLKPQELKEMVSAIRNIEDALGSGVKKPSPSERKNIKIARKSIVAARAIKKGEVFTSDNLAIKRPASGISPMRWEKIIGSLAKKDFQADELIKI